MSLFASWKAGDLKWRLDLPYMTDAERNTFMMFRDSGQISAFRALYCQGRPKNKKGEPEDCKNEVPNVTNDQGEQAKRFCSQRCYASVNPKDDDK